MRGVSAISLNTLVQFGGALLFVALVPRTLGPEVYGRMAAAYALMALLQLAGELGYQEVFARFLPETEADPAARRRLVRRLLRVKLATGCALGLLALPAARTLTAPGWLTWADAGLVALSVLARIWAAGLFALLLGLGRTGRWSIETTWRPLLITVLVVWVLRARTLTAGLLALATHEVLFLLAGLWWTRHWLLQPLPRPLSSSPSSLAAPRSPLRPLLRFGLTFAVANLGLALLFRVAPLVAQWLTGAAAQVGYLDLALGGVLMVFTFVGQLAYASVPILTRLALEGRREEAARWLGRFVRYATLLCVAAGGGMWLLAGSLAPLLFGAQFGAAAAALRALAPGLLALPLIWAAGVSSAVEKTPGRMARAALAGLAVFLAAAWAFSRAGWPSAAASVGAGFSLGLAGTALGTGRAGWRAGCAGGRGWLVALGTAAPFGLAALWPGAGSGLGSGLLAWGAGLAGAGLLALGGGALSIPELRRGLKTLTGLAHSVIQFPRR